MADPTGHSEVFTINNARPVVVLVRGLRVAWETDDQVPHYWDQAEAFLEQDCEVWVCNTITGMDGLRAETERLDTFIRNRIADRKLQGCDVPREINIVAHSYGGLISRQFMHTKCNYKRELLLDDGEKVKIGNVVMLSAVNCGSHLADKFPALPFFDNQSALNCLRTGFVQEIFNLWVDDRVPRVPYYLLAGRGGKDSADWTLREGWKHLHNWPKGTYNFNDGAVTVLSALGFAQSERQPTPVLQVGGKSRFTTNNDHTQMVRNQATLEMVRSILLAGSATSTASPQMSSAEEESLPWVLVALEDGIIEQGQTAETTAILDDCPRAVFSLDRGPGQVSFTLTKPDATVIDKNSSDPSVHYEELSLAVGARCLFTIDYPDLGTWTVSLHGDAVDPAGCLWSTSVTLESDVNVVPETDYFQPYGAALLKARVQDGDQTVNGATVTATILRPDASTETIELYDDGAHSDGAASDGLYANVYSGSATPGMYAARYTAQGVNSLGHEFQRVDADSFQVEPQSASLTGMYSDQGVDTGPPPGFEEISVDVGIHVAAQGNYAVSAALSDSGSNALAAATSTVASLPVGDATLHLYFSTDTLRRSGIDGPYKLTNVTLWDTSGAMPLRTDYAAEPYTTSAYGIAELSDNWPPESINDLTVSSVDPRLGNVTLRWNAPDNEGAPAASYDIRHLDSPLNSETWQYATSFANPPTPASPGSTETLTLSGISLGVVHYFAIKSRDAVGNESAISNVVQVYAGPPLDVRNAPSGTYGGLIGVVTASGAEFGGTYIESPDRAWGVLMDVTGLQQSRLVYATGVLLRAGAEPVLSSPAVYDLGAAEKILPLGIPGRTLISAETLSTTGLLVRMWGASNYLNETTFTLDDGSGSVRCLVPSGVTFDPGWQFVAVTGISSRAEVDGQFRPLIRVRDQNDIINQ